MKWVNDYQKKSIRITNERMTHIMEHPEMTAMEDGILETLQKPELVLRSLTDEKTSLYYRYYEGTPAGGKHLCIVVKDGLNDSFLLTAYLTDKIKKGKTIWSKK